MSLAELREKTFKLLKRRADYVAIQSYDAIKNKILGKTRRETVEKIYNTLKNIKLTNEKLSVSKLDQVAYKVKLAKEQAVKPIDEMVATIDSQNVNADGIQYTHHKQLRTMMRNHPNDFIIQVVSIYKNGQVVKTMKLELLSRISRNLLNKRIRERFFEDYEEVWKVRYWIEKGPGYTATIKTAVFKKATDFDSQKRLLQTFRANVGGTCVYDGFVSYFAMKKDKIGKSIYNKLIKYKNHLAKPYTLNNIDEIAKLCKSSIVIRDLTGGNRDIFINKHQGNLYELPFINNRYNHLDLLTCVMSDTKVVLNDTYNEIKKNSKWFIEAFGKLYTDTYTYEKDRTTFQHIYDSWKIRTKFDVMSIKSDSDIYKMLDGYDFNTHTFFNDYEVDDKLYKEIDLKKAYFNYSNKNINKFYNGVPSGSFICHSGINANDVAFTIEDFNKQWSNGVIGFYEVRLHFFYDKLNKYGFKNGYKYLLFSSMIKLLSQWANIEFLNIAIAPSIHCPFDDNFLDKDDGVSHYCKAVGLMMREEDYRTINVKPLDGDDKDFYHIIASENDNVYYNKNTGLFKFIKEVDVFDSHKHIAYAIHSYTTTLILDQLMKMDPNDVFGVKLDSIVYKKDIDVKFDDCFDIKGEISNIEKLIQNNYSSDELDDDTNTLLRPLKEPYYQSNKFETIFTITGDFIHNSTVLIGGQGGSGKTKSMCTSKNFYSKQICYTANSWDLIQAQLTKYNNVFYGLSLPKITGFINGSPIDKPTIVKNFRYIFHDETTLSNMTNAKYINDQYSHCFRFYIGDVDEDGFYYQASIDKIGVISPVSMKCQYIKYTKVFRHDDFLLGKLKELRKEMKLTKDINVLYDKFKLLFKDCFRDKDEVNFNNDDFGISSRNNIHGSNKCMISEYFINKGAQPQYYIKTTRLERGQLKGQRLLEQPKHTNYIMTLFRTIHAFQGRELDNHNSIIIYLDGMFDFNLFYTAVSRARRIDQIKIIDMLN